MTSLSAVMLVIDITIAGILCMRIKSLCISAPEKHGVFKGEKCFKHWGQTTKVEMLTGHSDYCEETSWRGGSLRQRNQMGGS